MKKQIPLFTFKSQKFFGGALGKGRRKNRRPLSTRDPIHLVLKSSLMSKHRSFRSPTTLRPLRKLIESECRKWGIRLYRVAINSDHCHFIILIPNRICYRRWISSLTSQISFLVGHARLGKRAGRRLFDARPFTRIVSWGRDFQRMDRYLEQNIQEALGFVAYSPRTNWYRKMLESG